MQHQLFTREFIPPKSNAIVKTVSKALLMMTPESKRNSRRKKLLEKIVQYNSNGELNTVAIETMGSMKITYSKNLLDEHVLLPFEGREFMCFKEWEHYLVTKFGDYMQLPPEEERNWRHHPIVLEFECTEKV